MELNENKVRNISTSTVANEPGILVELTSLITSGLDSIIKDKFTDSTKRETAAGHDSSPS